MINTCISLQQSLFYARGAHDGVGQKRKYTGDPYWVHPQRVGDIVQSYGGSVEMIQAAHLHDVVEDTGATIDDIEFVFGSVVAELVEWLTDVSEITDGNRAVRKAIDRHHIAAAPYKAQIIKIADMIDNSLCIFQNDPDFAEVYVREKLQLLDAMRPEVKEQDIWKYAYKIVQDYLMSSH